MENPSSAAPARPPRDSIIMDHGPSNGQGASHFAISGASPAGSDGSAQKPVIRSPKPVIRKPSPSEEKKAEEKKVDERMTEEKKAASSTPVVKKKEPSSMDVVPKRVPLRKPQNLQDPSVVVGIAYRVKLAFERQQIDVKRALLEEQKRRVRAVEALIPSKNGRIIRALERQAKEYLQKRAEVDRQQFEFLLPEEYVPDALEVWAFCRSHEQSLKVTIGAFRDFENALLDMEPNATFDAIAVGLLLVVQAEAIGKAAKFLVNELTWPEMARRTLIHCAMRDGHMKGGALTVAEDQDASEKEPGAENEQEEEPSREEDNDNSNSEIMSQTALSATQEEETEEIEQFAWKDLERDPTIMFNKKKPEVAVAPESWPDMNRSNAQRIEHFVKAWGDLCHKNSSFRLDFLERLRGLLNKVKIEPSAKLVWAVDYRNYIPSLKDIPVMADYCILEELTRSKYFANPRAFLNSLNECYFNMKHLFGKKPKEGRKELLDALESTKSSIETLFLRWVLAPPPLTRGPWTVWAKCEQSETEVCRECRGQRRYSKKSQPPVFIRCKSCEIPYHQDCYQAALANSGDVAPTSVMTELQTVVSTSSASKSKKAQSASPRGKSKEKEADNFTCRVCLAIERDKPDLERAWKEAEEKEKNKLKEEAEKERERMDLVVVESSAQATTTTTTPTVEGAENGASCTENKEGQSSTTATSTLSNDDLDAMKRIWLGGVRCPVPEPSRPFLNTVVPSHNAWGGLRGGRETPATLLRLARKLGRCEPAQLDIRERLRLLLFLSREASMTEACREEAEKTAVAKVKELQVDFNKHRKTWMDECARTLESSLTKIGPLIKREITRKFPRFPPLPEVIQKFVREDDEYALFPQREPVSQFVDRVKRYLASDGYSKEIEQRLVENPLDDAIQLTLSSDDESDLDAEDYDTESDYDSDDSVVSPLTAHQLALLPPDATSSITTKRFDGFMRTLDPEAIPDISTTEINLARSVDIGPSIGDIPFQIRQNMLPSNDPKYFHPAVFDHYVTCLRDLPPLRSFDPAKTSPVYLGVVHTRMGASSQGGAGGEGANGVGGGKDGAAGAKKRLKDKDENGQPIKRRRKRGEKAAEKAAREKARKEKQKAKQEKELEKAARKAMANEKKEAAANAGGDKTEATTTMATGEGGEKPVKQRRRRRKKWEMEKEAAEKAAKALALANGEVVKAVVPAIKETLDPAVKICPVCAFPFAHLERSLHQDCQAVLDRINDLVQVSDSDKKYIQALAQTFFQAEHDSLAACMRIEPCAIDESKRYWRFRGEFDLVYVEDMSTGLYSICSRVDNCPLQVKWFLSGNGLGSGTAGKSKLVTQFLLPASIQAPSIHEDIRLRGSVLMMSSAGASYRQGIVDVDKCAFCSDMLQQGDWHCLCCHRTFHAVGSTQEENEAVMVKHAKDCRDRTEYLGDMANIETCLYGPSMVSSKAWSKFLRLKQFVLDCEASLPLGATRFKIESHTGEITAEQRQKVRVLTGGWEGERRAMWVDRVKRCVTPAQLMKLFKVLEATVDPRWVNVQSSLPPLVVPGYLLEPATATGGQGGSVQAEPTAASVGEADSVAGTTAAVPATQAVMVTIPENAVTDVVVAKVALKLFTLDQDVRFECAS